MPLRVAYNSNILGDISDDEMETFQYLVADEYIPMHNLIAGIIGHLIMKKHFCACLSMRTAKYMSFTANLGLI